ncbi:amidase [Streptomyces sp. H10-C2]|uniref:amidase n=1 Tax=unclassified Streptomyces TaxID=2593676 RepID=UPI0024BA3DC3|nr:MULTISPECIES: amidase [unclassified Streptomyces]MDJ0343498.1 amidase [Streptomyces sp. PH10-H1]MDJ0371578.1 amidase [Streptomyces sp. H10-C2]
MSTTPHLRPATEQINALIKRLISSRELLELHLKHIATVNPGLNAIVTLDAERARKEADAADTALTRTGRPTGALHGLPITVKDALETAGMRTTCGAPDLTGHVPSRDADAIARLRAAGAIIIGKTNTPTYCQDIQTSNPIFGTTRNPYSPTRTAGGSSGGPAVSVAAGLSSLEVGSDLAGSLRLPAAYCGVYALRPSHGLIATRGHLPRPPGWLTSSDMMTLGPLARTPADLELLLSVLAGPAPADAPAWRVELPSPRHNRLGGYRIGIWPDDPYCAVDSATRALIEQVTGLVRKAGARVDDTTRPVSMPDSDHLFQKLMYATSTASSTDAAFQAEVDAAANLSSDDRSPGAFYLRSRTQRHRDWMRVDEERAKLCRRWAAYFTDHDILITPAAPTAAVEDQTSVPVPNRYITVDGQRRSYYDQTTWANLTSHVRLPAAIVPAGLTPDGLPLAVQIVGPYLTDRTVIAVAELLARLLPPTATPPAFQQ